MAGEALPAIDVIDLSHVRGGFERAAAVQREVTRALGRHVLGRHAIGGHAIAEYADIGRAAGSREDSAAKTALSLLSRKPHRRSGSGPASGPMPAPALPPTSTLTR
jgi:hypothetical protein